MKAPFLLFVLLCTLSTAYAQKSVKVLDGTDVIPLSSVDMNKAQALFSEMKTSPLFNMADCNNCEDRANAIAYILQKRGLTVAKFWLFGEGKISLSNQVYLLKSTKCGTWGYHVAVGLLVDNNGTQDTVIIDPATQVAAVTLSNWALPLLQANSTGYLAVKDPKYYTYPVMNNKFQTQQAWTAVDNDLFKTACGLCGLKPKQCGKSRFQARIRAKKLELEGMM